MDWPATIERVGIPLSILGVVLWFGWQVFRWAAKTIFEPGLQEHIETSRVQREALVKIVESLDRLDRRLDGVCLFSPAAADPPATPPPDAGPVRRRPSPSPSHP